MKDYIVWVKIKIPGENSRDAEQKFVDQYQAKMPLDLHNFEVLRVVYSGQEGFGFVHIGEKP